MKVVRAAAFSAVLAGASIGLASPASADLVDGTYTATMGSGATSTNTWVVTSCGPGCAHVEVPGLPNGTRDLRLEGSTWSETSDIDGDGVSCTTTVDNASLAGNTGCGFMVFPLQLTLAG